MQILQNSKRVNKEIWQPFLTAMFEIQDHRNLQKGHGICCDLPKDSKS